MMKIYSEIDNLTKSNLPTGSTITGINLAERFGSTVVEVHYTVTEEYLKANDLWHYNRIMSIRLIQAEGDKSLPIMSFASNEKPE